MSIKETIHSLITDESAAHKRVIEYVTGQLSQGRTLAAVLDVSQPVSLCLHAAHHRNERRFVKVRTEARWTAPMVLP